MHKRATIFSRTVIIIAALSTSANIALQKLFTYSWPGQTTVKGVSESICISMDENGRALDNIL